MTDKILHTKARQLCNHGIKGLYHGLGATIFFRSFFFFWWGSYDIITRLLLEKTSLSTPSVNFWAGGLSAQIYWLTSYPSDVVKQRIMTDSLGSDRRFHRWRDAATTIYREAGWRGFWRGFTPCALRAFPANAVALVSLTVYKMFVSSRANRSRLHLKALCELYHRSLMIPIRTYVILRSMKVDASCTYQTKQI